MFGESRLGTSEMDREVGRFWKSFAVIATVIAVVGGVAWIWLFAIGK